MPESYKYKTIKGISSGIYKEKGSRFIAFAYPVTTPEEIKVLLEKLRKDYHDARHHCYAYMLGQDRLLWRVNDDGEPSGTGGKPILGQINSNGLTNLLIVVIRYFGGTLLGVSGLINAYKSAAADALSKAEIVERSLHEYYELNFPYESLNDVMKILKEEDSGHTGQNFNLACSITINFPSGSKERILNRLKRIDGLKTKYLKTE